MGQHWCLSPSQGLQMQSIGIPWTTLPLLINQPKHVVHLFIFLSPWFLISHQDVLNLFVTCAHEHTLPLIAMDEAHIHVQHWDWASFRVDICALGEKNSGKYMATNHASTPEAHCAYRNVSKFICPSPLDSVDYWFKYGDCIVWGSAQEFCQREIVMKL